MEEPYLINDLKKLTIFSLRFFEFNLKELHTHTNVRKTGEIESIRGLGWQVKIFSNFVLSFLVSLFLLAILVWLCALRRKIVKVRKRMNEFKLTCKFFNGLQEGFQYLVDIYKFRDKNFFDNNPCKMFGSYILLYFKKYTKLIVVLFSL